MMEAADPLINASGSVFRRGDSFSYGNFDTEAEALAVLSERLGIGYC
jgi:hypothetical protein